MRENETMEQNTKPDLSSFKDLSVDELEEMQHKLTDFVQKRKSAQKKEALEEIKRIVAEHELDYDDVTKAIRTSAKRGKAPALYRNPDKPRQTWSGKGEPPDWYTNAPDKAALRISDD